MSDALFGFCQFEFPWLLGPAPGRYVLREQMGEAPRHVLVVAELGAPRRRRLGPRRRGDRAPGRGRPRPSAGHGGSRGAHGDPPQRAGHPRGLRSRWPRGAGRRPVRSVPLPQPGRHRRGAKGAQERLAALLGGRDAALACEELSLRARSDVDAGREREQHCRSAWPLDAALAELPAYAGRRTINERLGHLGSSREGVEAAAQAALRGGLTPNQLEHVILTLRGLEAALRAVATDP